MLEEPPSAACCSPKPAAVPARPPRLSPLHPASQFPASIALLPFPFAFVIANLVSILLLVDLLHSNLEEAAAAPSSNSSSSSRKNPKEVRDCSHYVPVIPLADLVSVLHLAGTVIPINFEEIEAAPSGEFRTFRSSKQAEGGKGLKQAELD
jgi:hypothetical protein